MLIAELLLQGMVAFYNNDTEYASRPPGSVLRGLGRQLIYWGLDLKDFRLKACLEFYLQLDCLKSIVVSVGYTAHRYVKIRSRFLEIMGGGMKRKALR